MNISPKRYRNLRLNSSKAIRFTSDCVTSILPMTSLFATRSQYSPQCESAKPSPGFAPGPCGIIPRSEPVGFEEVEGTITGTSLFIRKNCMKHFLISRECLFKEYAGCAFNIKKPERISSFPASRFCPFEPFPASYHPHLR